MCIDRNMLVKMFMHLLLIDHFTFGVLTVLNFQIMDSRFNMSPYIRYLNMSVLPSFIFEVIVSSIGYHKLFHFLSG